MCCPASQVLEPDIQHVWVNCQKDIFDLNREVLLGAVYTNPQGRLFPVSQVREQPTHPYDKLVCAAQVASDLLVCGDLHAKIGSLDAHLRFDLIAAAAYGLVFMTGRVHGGVGQHTSVGYCSDARIIQ
eukprot:217864-Pelagomonas_calceolata.AAC.1